SPGSGRPGVACGGAAHGGPMRRLARWATAAAIVALALYVVLHRLGSYDVLEVGGASALPRSRLRAYEYVFHLGRLPDLHDFYQTATYAVHSLRDGSRGLWWNPYQNCGQPFLGRIAVAQLYPLFVPSFLGGGALALWIIAFVHLVIGGGGMYLLCRELGAG